MLRFCFQCLIVMSFLGMIVGCDEDIPIKKLPSQLILEAYKPSGELVSETAIENDNAAYQKLSVLLNDEVSGWKIDFVSYKPGPYIFRGENIAIKCYRNMLVIDVKKLGQSVSMSKHVPNLLQKLSLKE